MTVGVIGFGSIARKHIDALREIHPQTEFYALRHQVDAPAKEGIANVFSIGELLEKNPDFILVSNPTAAHFQTLTALAGNDIPLFIEKPLFDRLHPLPDVSQLTYVACNLRFLGCLNFVKENLSGRRINEVNMYCGSYLPEWRPVTDWRSIYSANKSMGGGVHIDLIHEIDYAYWLFGAPDSVRKTFRHVSSLEIDAYDYANYCLEYGNFTASVILNYYRRDYKRILEIVFDDCTWEADLAKNMVVCNGKILYESPETFADTYKKQMRHFLEAIRSGKTFNSVNEAYDVLKICLE